MSSQAFDSIAPETPNPTPFTAESAEGADGNWGNRTPTSSPLRTEHPEAAESGNRNPAPKPATPSTPYHDPFEVRTDGPRARPWPDEPWRVKIWSEADDARERATPQLKVARWRAGDLARLKEDTPHGVLKYVATHDDGFWGQMAAKLLKDADRLEEMAKEVVPFGTAWHVDTDLEKLQQLKEEREARRAKEEAERQQFIEKQHEKLKRAGEAPRCEHVYMDGRRCKGPQMKGEPWCYNHKQMMTYRPGELTMAPLEDENALMVNILQIQRALITGRLTEKTAALLLYSVAIAAPSVGKVQKPEENSPCPDRAEAARPGTPQSMQRTQREIGEKQNLETTEATEETEEGKSNLPLMNTESTDLREKQGLTAD